MDKHKEEKIELIERPEYGINIYCQMSQTTLIEVV